MREAGSSPLICMNVIKKIRYSATPPITPPQGKFICKQRKFRQPINPSIAIFPYFCAAIKKNRYDNFIYNIGNRLFCRTQDAHYL